VRVLQEHTVSCVAEPSQVAAVAAAEHRDVIPDIRDAFSEGRTVILDHLNEIPAIEHGSPCGAFYVFADVSDLTSSRQEFVQYLLKEVLVGVIPDSVFGPAGEGFLRFSYATNKTTIDEAMSRLERAVESYL